MLLPPLFAGRRDLDASRAIMLIIDDDFERFHALLKYLFPGRPPCSNRPFLSSLAPLAAY